MKRRDEGRASLVDFLRSLKYSHGNGAVDRGECPTHFAQFKQRARTCSQFSTEDSHLIRSAN